MKVIHATMSKASKCAEDSENLKKQFDKRDLEVKQMLKSVNEAKKLLQTCEKFMERFQQNVHSITTSITKIRYPKIDKESDLGPARFHASANIERAKKTLRVQQIAEAELGDLQSKSKKLTQDGSFRKCLQHLHKATSLLESDNNIMQIEVKSMAGVGCDMFRFLPDEMVGLILSYCGDRGIRLTCKRFRDLWSCEYKLRRHRRYFWENPIFIRCKNLPPLRHFNKPSVLVESTTLGGDLFSLNHSKLKVGKDEFEVPTCYEKAVVGNRCVALLTGIFEWYCFSFVTKAFRRVEFDVGSTLTMESETDNFVVAKKNEEETTLVVMNCTGCVLAETDKLPGRPFYADIFGGVLTAVIDCLGEGSQCTLMQFDLSTGKTLHKYEDYSGRLPISFVNGVCISSGLHAKYILSPTRTVEVIHDKTIWAVTQCGHLIFGDEETYYRL